MSYFENNLIETLNEGTQILSAKVAELFGIDFTGFGLQLMKTSVNLVYQHYIITMFTVGSIVLYMYWYYLIKTVSGNISMLKSSSWEARRDAAKRLGELGDKRAKIPVLGLFKDKNGHVRKEAVEALGKLGDNRTIEQLKELLISSLGYDINPKGSGYTARKVAELKATDLGLRIDIVASLEKFGVNQEEMANVYIEALKSISNFAWSFAIRKLEWLGDKRAVAPLLEMEGRDIHDSWTWKHVSENTGAALKTMTLSKEEVVEGYITVLKSSFSESRLNATKRLGKLEDKRAVEPILGVLEDKNEQVRKAAIEALGKLEDKRIGVFLLKKTEDDNPSVRKSAVWALGELGNIGSIDHLFELLEYERNDNVWEALAIALGKLGDKRAVVPLLKRIENDNPRVRESVVWSLGELGDNGAIERLFGLFKYEKNDNVWAAIARALGKLGHKPAVAFLLKRIEDDNSKVRKSVVWALKKLNNNLLREKVDGMIRKNLREKEEYDLINSNNIDTAIEILEKGLLFRVTVNKETQDNTSHNIWARGVMSGSISQNSGTNGSDYGDDGVFLLPDYEDHIWLSITASKK